MPQPQARSLSVCNMLVAAPLQAAGTAGEHCSAAVRARVSVDTPALHRLANVRECFMPYWSRGPQRPSHAATIACAACITHAQTPYSTEQTPMQGRDRIPKIAMLRALPCTACCPHCTEVCMLCPAATSIHMTLVGYVSSQRTSISSRTWSTQASAGVFVPLTERVVSLFGTAAAGLIALGAHP